MAGCSRSVELEFIKNKNSIVLIRGGYQYIKKKVCKSHVKWECTKRKKEKCRGYVTLQDNVIRNENKHTCTPDFIKNEKTRMIYDMKKQICNPEIPSIPSTYNKSLVSLKKSDPTLLQQFPTLKTIKSALYDHRNYKAGLQKVMCQHIDDIKVPHIFQHFLLADFNDDDTRILIFCSEHSKKIMRTCHNYFGDGTFKVCPKPFRQLYTIHGDMGSSEESTNVIPLLYILMTDKSQKSYERTFYMIKSQIPEWTPTTFKSDFEEAPMIAISTIFRNIVIKGCYFHYSQAVWKKGRQLNLTSSINLKRQVALSAILPLLPREKIIEGWFYVASESPDDVNSGKFRRYMLNEWLGDEKYIDVWCAFGERHRTTNALESWHHTINEIVKKKYPSLLKLLHCLKEDSDKNEVQTQRPPKKRLQKYILRDQFIQELQIQLVSGDISVPLFLEKLRR